MKEGVVVRNLKNCLYDKTLKEWVEYPEEVYRELERLRNRIRHQEQYHKRCYCPWKKVWLCDANCEACEFHKKDLVTQEREDENKVVRLEDTLADSVDMEVYVADSHYYGQALERLYEIMPEAREIGRLKREEKTNEQIAQVLKIPRMTLYRHMRKAKRLLMNEFSDLFKN